MTSESNLGYDSIFAYQLDEMRESVTSDFRKSEEKEKLIQVAAHAYIALADIWHLDEPHAAKLLGISEADYSAWQMDRFEGFGEKEFEKISCLVGIYKYVSILYSGQLDRVGAWMWRSNDGCVFCGKSPIEILADATPEAFYVVRRSVAAATV